MQPGLSLLSGVTCTTRAAEMPAPLLHAGPPGPTAKASAGPALPPGWQPGGEGHPHGAVCRAGGVDLSWEGGLHPPWLGSGGQGTQLWGCHPWVPSLHPLAKITSCP